MSADRITYRRKATGEWQHFVDGHQIGPRYRTLAELLGDHANYMQRAGWIQEQTQQQTNATTEGQTP